MIELVLAIFVIPKTISPVAQEAGRSGIKWSFICIGVFLAVEIGIVTLYLFIYQLLAVIFQLKQPAPQFWLTPIIYIIALVGGLLSVDIIRRYLGREVSSQTGEPPPPKF